MIYEFHIFCSNKGKRPFVVWYKSIKSSELKLQVMKRLDRAELGNLGYYKFLRNGVYEFRIHFGAGYRVYFALHGEHLILLSGGSKATQEKDVKIAEKYSREFQGQFYD